MWRPQTLHTLPILFALFGVSAMAQPGAITPMVLEVRLNGTRHQELLNVERLADTDDQGRFRARAGELRRLRLKVDPALPADAMVWLDTLPGLTLRYDEPAQALALQVPDSLLEPFVVNLGGQGAPTRLESLQSIPAGMLNYGLYHTHDSGKERLAGNAELLFTSRAGVFSTSGLYNSARTADDDKTVRLDSQWRYVDPQTVRSYTLGDFTSNALSWNNSVRLAGFQWASAFEQRSDIVTTALPQFSGSAALPSTLDLYVNQQKIYSGELPSGPFDLRSLPYVSGGDVTLVTTDATGRQISMTQPYYYSANLLRQGLTQFSVDLGVPRFYYGLKSADYDDTVFASGSVRYGLSNATTLEGHAETSADGLANLGMGMAQALGGRGVLSVSTSVSRYKGYHGSRAKLGTEGQVGGMRLFANVERGFGDYLDLARVSSLRLARREGLVGTDYGTWLLNSAQASAVDRAGISFTPFDRTSVNLSYQRIKYPGEARRTANLSASKGLSRRVSLFASAYADLDRGNRHGVYLTLNIVLDGNLNVSASAQQDNGRTRYTQQVTEANGARQGDVGWGLSNTMSEGADDLRSGYITYRARQAQLSARIDQYGSATRTRLEAEGTLLAAGGGVFAANRIGEAYAIVTNAGPNAEVLQGGVRMGRTDGSGRALLPNLRPYYEQKIFIDPATLPDGWEPAVTERSAVAGYRQGTLVDFGARIVHGAELILHDSAGKPLPAGHLAQLEGGETGVIGYGGLLYLRGLGSRNRVTVDLGMAGMCSVDFNYDPAGPAQPRIGPLPCQ